MSTKRRTVLAAAGGLAASGAVGAAGGGTAQAASRTGAATGTTGERDSVPNPGDRGHSRAAGRAQPGKLPVREHFGTLDDGTVVERWTVENGGLRLCALSYGGIVQSLDVPDRLGRRVNVSLGFADLASYVADSPYFGALIGRYGNRIAKGQFTLDGKHHRLPVNDGPNSLHGGKKGFDKHVWHVEPFARDNGECGLTLTRTSPDGEQGYPGTLHVRVDYALTAQGDFRLDYEAVTDAPTVVNLTNHNYFNLAGEGSGDIYGHELTLVASRCTPVDKTLIPTGELADVAGTPLDFRRPKPIGRDLRRPHRQILYGLGYDLNYVLDKGSTRHPEHAATVVEPRSGRTMRVATTHPGVQFYSGNQLESSYAGTSGVVYRQGDGFAMETQHFPDSPNQPDFPSTVLRPGETYHHSTVYSFDTH